MNYPPNTIIQQFNVTAARLIQLPCFDDQQEPPDGFRAMVFQFGFQNGSLFPNQSGPVFTGGFSAVNFDLSSVIGNGNTVGMSKARSVLLSLSPNANSQLAVDPPTLLLFNSGAQFPVSGQNLGNVTDGIEVLPSIFACDFLSAIPELGVWVPDVYTLTGNTNTLIVANFKMNAQLTTAGLNVPGGG